MRVRKELLALLGAWSVKYKNQVGMHVLADIYDHGRTKMGLVSEWTRTKLDPPTH